MTWKSFLSTAGEVLNTTLFTIGSTKITLATILIVIAILIATAVISRILRRALVGVFRRRGVQDDGTVAAISRLLHYVVLIVGFGVALQTAGINLNAFFAAGAVFAVGIGFAMQNIVQNFVSGVILLVERAIKPGDVLEVESRVVKVSKMGIRATVVRTRDGEDLIVPNTVLVQSTVKNYTLKDAVYRVRATVGVTYSSELKKVQQTLEGVAAGLDWRLKELAPVVLLTEFGDSAVIFEVSVWIDNPWEGKPALSRANRAIWWALKEQEITIAFPQVDVHFDRAVEAGLEGLARAN